MVVSFVKNFFSSGWSLQGHYYYINLPVSSSNSTSSNHVAGVFPHSLWTPEFRESPRRPQMRTAF